MKIIGLSILLVIICIPLFACTTTGTESSIDSQAAFSNGYEVGYKTGFHDGATAGFNEGRFPHNRRTITIQAAMSAAII